MRALLLGGVFVAAAALVGCSGSPVAPTATTASRPVWALAGQSNAVLLEPALSQYATIVSASASGLPISFWGPGGGLGDLLMSVLTPEVSRLVWFQGESDADVGVTPGAPLTTVYVDRLRDLVARVRSRTRPSLFVVVCGMTNAPANKTEFDAMRTELQRFAATDANALYVSTLDLPSGNSQHLTDAGYASLAARIAAIAVPRISFAN